MKRIARTKKEKREKRHKRLRAKMSGTAKRPRLSVFKSNKHIYVQLINDEKGKTLFVASDLEIKEDKKKNKKTDLAKKVGQLIAKKSTGNKIKKVVFDRGGYKYQGRIKSVAEGAREGGLEF